MTFQRMVLVALGLLIHTNTAISASFDCSKATTEVEKLICDSNELRILDIKLHELYLRAQRASANPDVGVYEQRLWLRDIRNKCKTKECLMDVYGARIVKLKSDIRYEVCIEDSDGRMTTLQQSYCEGKLTDEEDKSIGDLVAIITTLYDSQYVDRFTKLQSEWRKNLSCNCQDAIGNGTGPGVLRLLGKCEKEGVEDRLSEIREIVAGFRNIEYSAISLRTCEQIRQEHDAKPENKLIKAISENDFKSVKRLVEGGVSIPRGDYYTPLDLAAENNNSEMVSYLLSNGANPDGNARAMRHAVYRCNLAIIKLLTQHGYNVSTNDPAYDPLPWAAQAGCLDAVKFFVSQGADIKSSSNRPLALAAIDCHIEMVRYLVASGAAVNSSKDPPLIRATYKAVHHPDYREVCKVVIEDLLKAGADPESALDIAKDDLEIKSLLSGRGRN